MNIVKPSKGSFGVNRWYPPSEQELSEFEQLAQTQIAKNYQQQFFGLTKNQQGYLLNMKNIGSEVVSFIDQKIESNTPFSIVRQNDGEGCIFFPEQFTEYPALGRYVVGKISEIIFGDRNVVTDNLQDFHALLCEATVSADIVGIPSGSFVKRRLYSVAPEDVDVRAVCGVMGMVSWLHSEFVESDVQLSAPLISSAWLSKELLPYYKQISRRFEKVVLVTGNPKLGSKVKNAFNLENFTQITIPTQRALKSSSDPSAHHYPDRFLTVMDSLGQLGQGCLVLVAAGLLGKPYCSKAKASGASAIDIGQVADVWEGKLSRPGHTSEYIEKWKL